LNVKPVAPLTCSFFVLSVHVNAQPVSIPDDAGR
jgi:hypothetical protein